MAPPTTPLNLDVEAISGICGSISIACWVVVFSPQILQNFQRGSADGLSIRFLIIWLLGDVFNILGAVLQGVLPTMIILAIYYTIADIVLLGQCFYYRGFTWKDEVPAQTPKPTQRTAAEPNERTNLLYPGMDRERRGSDWSNLSPAVPFASEIPETTPPPPPSTLQTVLWNTLAVVMVCAAGVLGWVLSARGSSPSDTPHGDDDASLSMNFWGQVFGYLCATLYITSRLPQLILNWRRKSTDGLSMLFFLFACLGNVTYVLSIMAYEPACPESTCPPGVASSIYGRYILVNLSWLLGSFVTLLLDFCVFAQYFLYKDIEIEFEDEGFESEDGDIDPGPWQRPLLARGDSTYG